MMDSKEMRVRHAAYIQTEFGKLVGKTIAKVRLLNQRELDMLMWDERGEVPFVLIMTDGTAVIPSRDPEGNGPGYLFVALTAGATA